MTALILAVQVAVPMALIAWLAFAPAGSLAGLILQASGTGAILFALARIAQWGVPVWWLPWVYGGLWLVAVLASLLRKRLGSAPLLPERSRDWAGLALSIVLLGLGGWYGARALAGQRMPPAGYVDIGNPFGPGRYLVGHGGSNTLVNGHMRTLDRSVERYLPWRGQSYGVDFAGLGRWGLRASGWRPADPAAYAIFGARLQAPCAGTVVAAEGNMPDLRVPNEDPVNRLGNHVILRCGDAEIVLAHMRQGSVAVAPGDRVALGDELGEVGNSGASTEPHLHIHAQRPAPVGAPPIAGEPLALRIDGRFLVRGDHLHASSASPAAF
ncbi:peptidoglycan DD-metalloendopeptidase family protein [Paracoccus tibetensis]|uniref:Peptidase family M23 n=1 Tax=Paracoccus tibetensis TaxID=336292 RepID=A0A1G5I615_9RHOB|nr:peptidoglycan DD-metalloendopeptidase family protein [Paracoccus tibetensis]SCY71374.1 Peptidase family M23 [Paracoccus tibetensis]